METILLAISGIILYLIAFLSVRKTYNYTVIKLLGVMRIIGIALIIISFILGFCNIEMSCVPEWLIIGGGIVSALFLLGGIDGISDLAVELIRAIPSGIFMLILSGLVNWLVWKFLPELIEISILITIILIGMDFIKNKK